MNNQNNNNSNLPLVIIGIVLLAAIGGGWWLYAGSKPKPKSPITSAPPKPTPPDTPDYNAVASKAPGAQLSYNVLGSPNATVTIEEFADYQCPTCATVHPKMKEINSIYGGRIRFIYRNFPLQMHKNGYPAAIAAEAAGQQGKYWQMQEQLFTNQQTWANSSEPNKLFAEYGQKIGLDVAKFENDLNGLPLKSRVDADLARGQALKITGTPSIFINGKQLAIEQMEVNMMRQIVESELQKPSSQAQPNQASNQAVSTSNQPVNGATISK